MVEGMANDEGYGQWLRVWPMVEGMANHEGYGQWLRVWEGGGSLGKIWCRKFRLRMGSGAKVRSEAIGIIDAVMRRL